MTAKEPEPGGIVGTAQRLGRTPAPPEEFSNPPGVGGNLCDIEGTAEEPEPCDPTEVEDLVLEESKPGYGISGYEGEEVGGG
jgi:hypothetical protein